MVSRIGIGPPPQERMVEMQAPLLQQGDASSQSSSTSAGNSPLERTLVDVRICVAEYLTGQELFHVYRVNQELQRVFHAEFAVLPQLNSSLQMRALQVLDPFFQADVERTDEFGRHLLTLRRQLAEDVKVGTSMARWRGHVLLPPRRFEISERDRIGGYSELLELVRLTFHRQVGVRPIFDRAQDSRFSRWHWLCLSARDQTFWYPGDYCFGCCGISLVNAVFMSCIACCGVPVCLPGPCVVTAPLVGCGMIGGPCCSAGLVYLPIGYYRGHFGRGHVRVARRMELLRQLWLGELLQFAESLPVAFPEEYGEQVQLYRKIRAWFLSEESTVIWESFRELKAVRFWQEREAFPSAFNPFYEGGNLGLKYLAFVNALRQVVKVVSEEHEEMPSPYYLSRFYRNSPNIVEVCRGNDVDRVKETLIQELVNINDCGELVAQLLAQRKHEMVELFILAGLDLEAFRATFGFGFHSFEEVGVFENDPVLRDNPVLEQFRREFS